MASSSPFAVRLALAAARATASAASAAATSSRLLSGSCASTSSCSFSRPAPSKFRSVSTASTSLLATSTSPLARSFSAAVAETEDDIVVVEFDDPSLPAPSFMVGPGRAPVLELDLEAAIAAVKSKASSRFDESVDAAFVLGIDPRRGDHSVRGAATLPAGTGKEAKVAFFADDGSEEAEAARAAGALVVGGDSLISLISEKGSAAIEFDRALATASMMPKLAKIARVLGPRGLMPNPKLGTVIPASALSASAVASAVAAASAGRVSFRADKGGVVHAPVGRVSFEGGAISQNVGALADALLAARPKALKGGGWSGYVKRIALSTTHGRGGVRVSLQSVAAAAAQAKAAARK